MRSDFPLFCTAVLISTVVAENNQSYVHALQTVFFYLAYRLEVLLNPDERIIGLRCREWDQAAKKCREVAGQQTHEPCPGSRNVRIPGGDLVRGICSLREFIVHVTGGGSSRDFPRLDKDDWTPHEAAEIMHDSHFGDGNLRPWAVVKDGGVRYISAIRTACGQVAKARMVALASDAVWDKIKDRIATLQSLVDDITLDRRVAKSTKLLPILKSGKKNNWGGITPEVDHTPRGDLFSLSKTLDKLKETSPDPQQYELRKKALEAEIEKFNQQDRTSTHNAAEQAWEDNKGLMVKDC